MLTNVPRRTVTVKSSSIPSVVSKLALIIERPTSVENALPSAMIRFTSWHNYLLDTSY